MKHEKKHLEELAKLLCRIKHPVLDPEKPREGTCGDPIYMFYLCDAEMLLDLFARFQRGRP